MDAALRGGESQDTLRRITSAQFRRRGVAHARQAVTLASPLAESPAESLSRLAMSTAGVPRPTLQYTLTNDLGGFVARCDFGWPAFRVVGECDGLAKYEDPSAGSVRGALRREKEREGAIRELGWWVVRWTYADITDPKRTMVRRIVRALVAHGWDGRQVA